MTRLLVSLAALVLVLCAGWALAAPDVARLVPVPDPLAEENPRLAGSPPPPPRPGETYADPAFGTRITRVTDTSLENGRHEYSRFDPLNSDRSLILLGPDRPGVYRTSHAPYNAKPPIRELRDCDEPRWDPAEPRTLWFTREKRLLRMDVSTGKETVVKDFARDPALKAVLADRRVWRITRADEGEASRDLRWWAFFVQAGDAVDYRMLHMFTWDRATDAVLGQTPLAPAERELDWIGMSPLGHTVLIGGLHDNGGRLQGLTMANRELTRFHRLDYTTAHADVGTDASGAEVVVMQNTRTDYIDMIPLSWATRPILENGGSYEGTGRTPLVRLFSSDESPHGLVSGVHVSANCPGWCVVSTHLEYSDQGQNWLDNVLLLVRLDSGAPKAWYLAQVFSTRGEYWEESHATLSRDGSTVLWATNWGRQKGANRVFLMRADLPVTGSR